MTRYGGYSESIEVLVDLLKEQRRTNELLEKLISVKETNVEEHPKSEMAIQRRKRAVK